MKKVFRGNNNTISFLKFILLIRNVAVGDINNLGK